MFKLKLKFKINMKLRLELKIKSKLKLMSNLRLMLKNLIKKKITKFIYFFLIISVRKFNSRKIICKYGILGY